MRMTWRAWTSVLIMIKEKNSKAKDEQKQENAMSKYNKNLLGKWNDLFHTSRGLKLPSDNEERLARVKIEKHRKMPGKNESRPYLKREKLIVM